MKPHEAGKGLSQRWPLASFPLPLLAFCSVCLSLILPFCSAFQTASFSFEELTRSLPFRRCVFISYFLSPSLPPFSELR